MDDRAEFARTREAQIRGIAADTQLASATVSWIQDSWKHQYFYHFDWLGLPVIQFPADIVALQEVVWRTKPDLIVETGVARGGSLALSASLLALLDIAAQGADASLVAPNRRVVGVDIDIRQHNREAIEAHPFANRIHLVSGSSVDPLVLQQVSEFVAESSRVMVLLDSLHTHDHVLAELNAYSPFVSEGCYLIVYDTLIEELPPHLFADRPWDPGNSPGSALQQWLPRQSDFVVDTDLSSKLLMSTAPGGYLLRV